MNLDDADPGNRPVIRTLCLFVSRATAEVHPQRCTLTNFKAAALKRRKGSRGKAAAGPRPIHVVRIHVTEDPE